MLRIAHLQTFLGGGWGGRLFTMRTGDFEYRLPQELIAQTPLEPRDSSRLLVLHRDTRHVEHRDFANILEYVHPGDVMVFNQSRVIPARLYGSREDTGGKVELLLLRREGPGTWQALAQPGRRLRPGVKIIVGPYGHRVSHSAPHQGGIEEGSQPGETPQPALKVEILASHDDGVKTVWLEPDGDSDLLGEIPLPPYIHRRLKDPERYQTVYAQDPGSVAAPTAGLHFTEKLLGKLKEMGVELAFVTLHVGLDTFRPVQGEDPTTHKIHTEYFELGQRTARLLNIARDEGRRIIAVGTTSVRVLEQTAQLMLQQERDQFAPASGQASLYILPGYKFQAVDAMITNFHLPRSTLLMLVSAFAGPAPPAGSGLELVLNAYQEAISLRYRFYSFGDAMLIL